ncbi:M81 family metallopeptidase [Kribbella sp. NPDC050281]|uniref:M81 family metallopeptidase n=1 Tax=Kribbella sp. NPDC050281 TaxID=3155515 RepID=UPI0033DD608D
MSSSAESGRLRIGIAGIAIESSTFSPHRTRLDDFHVTRGDELLGRYDFLAPGKPLTEGVEWVPLLHARAVPGGPVVPEVYDELAAEIYERLGQAGQLDGVFVDMHGAMSVIGRTDIEADLVGGIRRIVGSDVLLSTGMDLHGNMSRELIGLLDLATCYRKAPHTDAWDTKERAARNLVARLRSGGRPLKAWVQVPVLLPGEKTSTRIEPAKSIYAQVDEVEAMDGVLDAAIWVGYAWADEPRCQAAVVVMGDDEQVITAQAKRLADAYWDAHDKFEFVAPTGTLAECLDQALASTARPFYISDSGDNPTAGGAGDTSWTLDKLLRMPAITESELTTIYAAIVDPEVTTAAMEAGVGATISVEVGGKIDSEPWGPVALTGRVTGIDSAAGAVALAVGGLHVIVTMRRKPYHIESDFVALGLAPRDADLVIVKIGYLEPELYAMAADWLLALTPGGVNQDLLSLGHHRIERPMFPFDPDMPDPDLTPEII